MKLERKFLLITIFIAFLIYKIFGIFIFIMCAIFFATAVLFFYKKESEKFSKISYIQIQQKNYTELKARNKFEKFQKGRAFENDIKSFYENLGYKIYPQFLQGKEDCGIDLIAYKRDLALLIQCKNWTIAPNIQDLEKFINDSDRYLKFNKMYLKNKNVKKIFITTYKDLDENTKDFINKSDILYQIAL